MKKIFTICSWVFLLNFGWIHAQEYTDTDIGFEFETIRKELIEHEGYTSEEIANQIGQLRSEYVTYYEAKLEYLKSGAAREAAPIPVTSCVNMDFSQNTDLWTLNANRLNYGTRPSQDTGPMPNSWGVQGSIFQAAINDPTTGVTRFQVMPANTVDPRLNMMINPNAPVGSNVMRLGDPAEFPNVPNINSFAGQEEISKSYILTEENAVLRYGYAIVFEEILHNEIPNSFDIFIAVNGAPLTGCSEINWSYNDALNGNGFVQSALNPLDLVRPWTTNTIDLLAIPNVQLGDVITISFRNRDCGFTIHGSYAYVSAECLPSSQAITATSASGDFCTNEEITFTTDVDIVIGSITQWQIVQGTNIITTIPNGGASVPYIFTQEGTYTVNFTMTSPGGCTVNSSTDIVVTDCCIDCNEAGSDIIASIAPVKGECGTYQVEVVDEVLDCYTLEIFTGDGSGWTTITASDLDNGIYEFSYTENGNYTVAIRLIDPTTGKACLLKRQTLQVNCCLDCNDVGTDIFESLLETETCGAYTIHIPEGTLDCYKVIVRIDTDNITLSEAQIVNEIFTFSFDENGNYAFTVTLYDLNTNVECHYSKGAIPVDCFVDPSCGWPKTIGTDNPVDPFTYDSEYVSDIEEDNTGDLVVLGRARVGADIAGILTTSETYVAKYDADGCLQTLINMPTINFPVQMKLQGDNSMIILSRENTSSIGPETFYLDKYTSGGVLIWRTSINMEYHVEQLALEFILREQNDDIFLNLPYWETSTGTSTVLTDAGGNVSLFDKSAVLRFTNSGLLTWSEEFNALTGPPGFYITDPKSLDFDFNESTNELWVLVRGKRGSTFELVNQGAVVQLDGVIDPYNLYREAALRFSVNDAAGTISYVSNFNLDKRASVTSRIASSNNNVYVSEHIPLPTVPFPVNYVNIYTQTGALVSQKVMTYRVKEMENIANATSVIVHGYADSNNGFGLSKFTGLNQVWSHSEQTITNAVLTYDVMEHSDGKIYLSGLFDDNVGPFAPTIGGYDGFITRFSEGNGTLVPGFTGTTSSESDEIQRIVFETQRASGFPNPFVSSVTIKNESEVAINQIEVYNLYGTLLLSQKVSKGTRIEMPTGASGVYFAKVYFEDGVVESIQLVRK